MDSFKMFRLFILFIMYGLFTLNPLKAQERIFAIPANKAYAEPYENDERTVGVRIMGGSPEYVDIISNWTKRDRKVVWYLYQTPGQYRLSFDQRVKKGKVLRFNLSVSGVSKGSRISSSHGRMEWKGSGKRQETFASDIFVLDTGYFKYELTVLDEPRNAVEIHRLLFRSASAQAEVHQTDYLSSPSVHLTFGPSEPSSGLYNWLYEEINVPKGMDPLNTFYMAIGFNGGYLGMQTNSSTERRVLFSVWDNKDAENDKTISSDDYAKLIDKDSNTMANAFGGEGTGGQSYVKSADWKTGESVAFLMNILPIDGNLVVISAWYKLESQKQWNYVASWQTRKQQHYFNGFYSFLENYGYENGQLRRSAEYYNAWGRDAISGRWVNFNKAQFTNTDGKPGQRIDFEQGQSPTNPNRFYMSSGGYSGTVKRSGTIPISHLPPQLDLEKLKERVEKALADDDENNTQKLKEFAIKY